MRLGQAAIPLEAFEPPITNPTFDDFLDPVRRAKLIAQYRQESNDKAMIQVRALLAAGWKYELPAGNYDYDPWQWYWRAPPKRKNSRGQKYLSTNQAFNALQRAKEQP